MQHVVFSLLTGRPVLVAGAARLEAEVIKVIHALSVFVPATRRLVIAHIGKKDNYILYTQAMFFYDIISLIQWFHGLLIFLG